MVVGNLDSRDWDGKEKEDYSQGLRKDHFLHQESSLE